MSLESESADLRHMTATIVKGIAAIFIVLFVMTAQCTMLNRQSRQHSQDIAIAIVVGSSDQNRDTIIDALCMTIQNNQPVPINSDMCDILLRLKGAKK